MSRVRACNLHSISKKGDKYAKDLNLPVDNSIDAVTATEKAKLIKQKAKVQLQRELKKKWADKPLHGQYVKRTEAQNVSQSLTHQWLKSSGLKGETEGFIIAAQDQSLPTKNYKANISKVTKATSAGYAKTTKKQLTISYLDAQQ